MDSSKNPWQTHPGLFNANSYLASSIPYLTGSGIPSASFATSNAEMRFDFPQITRSITVINTGGPALRVHFCSIASGNVITGRHYTTLSGSGTSMTYGHRVRHIFVSLQSGSQNGDVEITAELTTIPAKDMFQLTGSGLTQ